MAESTGIQSYFGAGIAVCGWISIARTVSDGSPRLILRWRRARMRWKVQILYFPINVMKCYEISQNVIDHDHLELQALSGNIKSLFSTKKPFVSADLIPATCCRLIIK